MKNGVKKILARFFYERTVFKCDRVESKDASQRSMKFVLPGDLKPLSDDD